MKPIIEIIRLEENFRYGTFGAMRINKEVFCFTLERPDIENKPFESSIPAQQYLCKRRYSNTYGMTYEIKNVPDRDHVLFHPGNLVVHSKGCILLGEHCGKLKEERAILNSGKTFERFMKMLDGFDEFHLTITEVY